MKNWSIGYEILRYYVRFALWLTHKRIIVTGQHLIPKGKPIIFAANHQNALMDSLAVVCTNPNQSVWLARADIFKSKIARSILNYMKMLPVYRIRDGKENLSNNEQIFAQVIQVLEWKETIALFPEAAHSGRRQMLPHKKAIPRIALEAEKKNNFGLGLQIVPVGVYYSHYWFFNRNMIVQYGQSIEVDKYKDAYTDNPQKAMLSLRDEIHGRIVPLTMHITSVPFYQDYENIRQMAGKSYSKANHFSINPTLQLFYAEKDLIKKLESLEFRYIERFNQLIEKTRSYFSELQDKNLSDDLIKKVEKTGWTSFLLRFSGAICTLPIFITGFLIHAIPFLIPRNMIRKKVKDKAFMATFNFVIGLLIFPLFYFIEAGLILAITHSWTVAISAFILMPFVGKLSYKLLGFYQGTLHQMRFLTGNYPFRKSLKQLVKQRNDLVDLIIAEVNF